ncbi:leucine-rich repeat domain-containing protein [Treponema ruminis]|nr:leucine-rich repeat domain-containing protein [Treponema ruminis]
MNIKLLPRGEEPMRKFSRLMIVISHEGDEASSFSASVVEVTNGDNTVQVADFETALHMLPHKSEVNVIANGTVGNMAIHNIARIIRDSGVLVSLDLSSVRELNKVYDSPFKDNQNLISINFPQNITSINNQAFAGCKNLEHISIPASVQKIGAKAFDGCEKLVVLEFTDPSGWYFKKENGDIVPVSNVNNAEDNPYRFTLPSSPYRNFELQKVSDAQRANVV